MASTRRKKHHSGRDNLIIFHSSKHIDLNLLSGIVTQLGSESRLPNLPRFKTALFTEVLVSGIDSRRRYREPQTGPESNRVTDVRLTPAYP